MAIKLNDNKVANGLALPLVEIMHTIQGEGYNSGKAAAFIRLAGCDVGCHWCDVKESWETEQHKIYLIDEILQNDDVKKATNVVITGGEPLMHNLDKLTHKLQLSNKSIWLETSGTYSLSGNFDWICLSPKKFKLPETPIYKKANELKVIIYNRHDFGFAMQQAEQVNKNCKLFIQPEWSKEKTILPLMVDFVKNNPKWTISLQTHKYMKVP